MSIWNDEQKKELLESIETIGKNVPVMDMDDRDFTATLLYRMSEIVREHGPSHGINFSPYARFLYAGGRNNGKMWYTHELWSALKEAEDRKKSKFKLDEADIAKIIYNPPATIIVWKDGTKTVVKCSDEDLDAGRISPEYGIVYAIVKKILGNKGNYNNVLKRLVNRAVKY